MMPPNTDLKHALTEPVAIILLGIASFYCVVGWHTLDPTNIEWLPGSDPMIYFLGWDFFRHSPWEFPLGANPRYGIGISSSILYSDSIPLLAFLFKPFSSLLPEPFQYFGIWTLLCFTLQGWMGWKLIGLVTNKPIIRFFSAGIFIFSPPFFLRVGGHIALSGHWIILAALFLTISPSKETRWHPIKWIALCAAASLIHTYFLLIALVLWFTDALNRIFFFHYNKLDIIVEGLVVIGTSILCLWQAGLFLVATDSFSIGGYGTFRMNLLSIFDASGWSYILPDIPENLGDYEGFNFLGLGALSALLLILLTTIKKKQLLSIHKHHIFLLLTLILFFIIAITNKISIADSEINIPIPETLLHMANMFRASGRFFWPVYYVLLICIISGLIKLYKEKASALLIVFFIIQVVDTSAGWLEKKKHLTENSKYWQPPFKSEFWNIVPERYDKIRLIEPANNATTSDWYKLAYFSAINKMGTDSISIARIDSNKLKIAQQSAFTALTTGEYDKDSLYILKKKHLPLANLSLHAEEDMLGQVDGIYVVAPNWNGCDQCPKIAAAIIIQTVQIDQTLHFNVKSLGPNYLASGWSPPESWGVWSEGPLAKLNIPINTGKDKLLQLDIDAHAFLQGTKNQIVKVHINSHLVGTIEFSIKKNRQINSFPIPAYAFDKENSNKLAVTFKIASPIQPPTMGDSVDNRSLGIGLLNLTVREAEK